MLLNLREAKKYCARVFEDVCRSHRCPIMFRACLPIGDPGYHARVENGPMSDEAEFENEQLRIVEGLVGRSLTRAELEGFRIVYPRFIDRFGGTRLPELQNVFRTDLPPGRAALAASLRRVAERLGSYDAFAVRYPVTIIPPLPVYPLFPIVDIATFQSSVYRVLSSTNLPALTHIRDTGRLVPVPPPAEPVLRSVPRGHWCAYEAWPNPNETRRALQILPEWSDCEARATLATSDIDGAAFVAYAVDPNDPETRGLAFHGYFYEGLTQDHDDAPYDYPGRAVQICVFGDPPVQVLEEWRTDSETWEATWRRASM
jgi:hypothetical protein